MEGMVSCVLQMRNLRHRLGFVQGHTRMDERATSTLNFSQNSWEEKGAAPNDWGGVERGGPGVAQDYPEGFLQAVSECSAWPCRNGGCWQVVQAEGMAWVKA